MPRIILYTGKGGVGKTTVSSATGVALGQRGYRTLLLSFDLAHSLSDSLDLDRSLFDQNEGRPLKVAKGLEIQEINVQAELGRHWGQVLKYLAGLISSTGVSELAAEELAILPGMEDIVCLLYLNQYVKEGVYDVLIVDCPPTSESISFVSMTTTLRWYMEKRFGIDRTLVKLARPILSKTSYGVLPDDDYFNCFKNLFSRVEGIESILSDPKVTSVRLVTNAEKMVVKETQRAFLYFTLHGLTIDCVIVNRLMLNSKGYFSKWADTHGAHLREIEEYFQPVPVLRLPLFPDEMIGEKKLRQIAGALFGKTDPAKVRMGGAAFRFSKEKQGYHLHIPLPFVTRDEIKLNRQDSNLVVNIGSFRRHVPLPRALLELHAEDAQVRGGELVVRFVPQENRPPRKP